MPYENETATDLWLRYLATFGAERNSDIEAAVEKGRQLMRDQARQLHEFHKCDGCKPAPVWRR